MQKNSWFTLIEILISVLLTGIILGAWYSAFQSILRAQIRLSGIINIQKNIFYLNEKIVSLIHAWGTIDYEEYFNRRILGFEKSFSTEWIWTYTNASTYGNGDTGGCPKLYLCGKDTNTDEDTCLKTNAVAQDTRVADNACIKTNSITVPISAPSLNKTLLTTISPKQMAYGQYREIGLNYASLARFASPIKLPPIFPATDTVLNNEGTSDLYLIKKLPNGSYERTYFRHIFEQDPIFKGTTKVCNPATSLTACIGKIQMTRLVSCDSLPIGWDGIIDAWTMHPDFWGGEDPCSAIDSVAKIVGAAANVVWADINTPGMNVLHAGFLPTPKKHPLYMSGVGEDALAPTIRMRLEVDFSEYQKRKGMLSKEENTTRVLITTIDLDNY